MKKVGLSMTVAVLLATLVFAWTHYDPRRPRPEGWRAPWAALPLEPESAWAPDPTRRSIVQRLFVQVTDELTECSEEYFTSPTEDAVQLELLMDVLPQGTRVTFVGSPERPDFASGLLPCVERALERASPVPSPGVPVGTRWRLGLTFLLQPVSELHPRPWWERYVPERFRSGGSSGIHVG